MSFFKWLIRILAFLGFIIFLSCSIIFINIINQDAVKADYQNDENIEIYKKEEIKDIQIYIINNTMKIACKFNEDKEKDYCLSYAFYYFDKYNYIINLTVKNDENYLFIIISIDGKSTVTSI